MKIEKRCPVCGGELVILTNRMTGVEFLACRSSDCQHTEPLPESIRMRLAGAPTLPGIDDEVK